MGLPVSGPVLIEKVIEPFTPGCQADTLMLMCFDEIQNQLGVRVKFVYFCNLDGGDQ